MGSVNKIEWKEEKRKIKDLKDYDKNPRRISKEVFEKLVESIKQDGYHGRIMVYGDTILGGHQRKKALLKAGYKNTDEIAVIVPSRELSDDEFNRLNIRDNLPYGEFDFDILANEFDMDKLIEWGMPEEWLLGKDGGEVGVCESDDEVPDVPTEPTAKLGDIWLLGNHRLMCGDSISITDVERLLDKNTVDVVYTDPPYGINEKTDRAFAAPSRKAKGNTFDKIIGDTSTRTAIDSYNLCATMSIPVMVFWGANYYCHSLPESANWCVWDKREEEIQRDTNSDCELAWVKSKANSVRIFRHLWKGMIKASEHGQGRVHPTQKPVALALWCFKEYAPKSKAVLDLFGGSGSTLIACEKSGRICYMMELSPAYVDVIVARWEKLTGETAVLEKTAEI